MQPNLNQNKVISKDREESLEYFGVPYRKDIKASHSDGFRSEGQTKKMECQNREMNGLDGKH